jgi:hypothetical protein
MDTIQDTQRLLSDMQASSGGAAALVSGRPKSAHIPCAMQSCVESLSEYLQPCLEVMPRELDAQASRQYDSVINGCCTQLVVMGPHFSTPCHDPQAVPSSGAACMHLSTWCAHAPCCPLSTHHCLQLSPLERCRTHLALAQACGQLLRYQLALSGVPLPQHPITPLLVSLQPYGAVYRGHHTTSAGTCNILTVLCQPSTCPGPVSGNRGPEKEGGGRSSKEWA